MEETLELKKYLKKLLYIIENNATFTFFNTKLVETQKIDDILCCIEGSWPAKYKKFIDIQRDNRVQSQKVYQRIILATKNKFFLTSKYCAVRYKDAKDEIRNLMSVIDVDMKFIDNCM